MKIEEELEKKLSNCEKQSKDLSDWIDYQNTRFSVLKEKHERLMDDNISLEVQVRRLRHRLLETEK